MSLFWLIAVLPLAALGIAVLNVALWPRGQAGQTLPGTVSVLIPARNEASRIEETLRAALASRHPVLEFIVYDDASRDSTPGILAGIAEEDSRLRILQGEDLPEGWVGKPHACHRLAEAARGEFLCFLDADTRLAPRGLESVAEVFERLNVQVLTAVPRQITQTWFEKLVVPLLHLTYVSWLPLPLIWLSSDPRFLAANGQLLVLRSQDYRRFGGFAAVRNEVVDDMAFCRSAKQAGLRVVFADGANMAACRMYTSAREVWDGFSKNIYEGIGGAPQALLVACALNIGAFILPWIALPWAGMEAGLLGPSVVGIAANLSERALLAWRYEQPWSSIAFHPFSIAALLAIAVNSWRWQRVGAIAWRGRTYAPRPQRGSIS